MRASLWPALTAQLIALFALFPGVRCLDPNVCHWSDPACGAAWNLVYQTPGPAPAPTVVQISQRQASACAVLSNGAVRCWGDGGFGGLGLNNVANVGDGIGLSIREAGDVPLGGTAVKVAVGNAFACAILSGGAVRCWGSGNGGRLGHDSVANIGDGAGLSIIDAGDVPLGGSAIDIAAGAAHACAVLSTGALRCWGAGGNGRLGHNATANIGDGVGLSILAAGDVPLGGSAAQVVVGDAHTCARLAAGNVRCWGSAGGGKLGYNATAQVGDGVGLSIIARGDINLGATAARISVTYNHACALLTTGAIRCWGSGANGRLGYNATANIGDGIGLAIAAAGDLPLGATAIDVAAGQTHSCAVLSGGAVRCWGAGALGRLGYNATANIADGVGLSIIATGDAPLGYAAQAIAAGQDFTCALSGAGALRCWGSGALGKLGYNSTANVGDGIGLSIEGAGDTPVW